MSKTSSKVYKVGPRQQLIDLNNDVTNFKLTFNTESVNPNQTSNPNGTYQLLVVNQTQLDNKFNEKTPFKDVKGSLGGKIKADDNAFQNYFLILKAKNEGLVKVTISLEELEEKENLVLPPSTEKETCKWKRYLWIGVGVTLAVLVTYYIYKKCKENKKISSNDSVASEASSDFENESISNEPAPTMLKPITSNLTSTPKPVIQKPATPKPATPATPKPATPKPATPKPVVKIQTPPKPAIFNSNLNLENVDDILKKFSS